MNIHKSHKVIVAGGMAAVIGIGVVTFALRSDPVSSVAETPPSPSPVADSSATAPDSAAQSSAAPAAVAQMPDAPAAVQHDDSVGTKNADTASSSAIDPKLARNKHPAKAANDAAAPNTTVTRTGAAAATREEPAVETLVSSIDRTTSADELTPPTTGSSPADEQKVATRDESAASDSQITADVKYAIAGDSLSRDFNIGVTTIRGVVVLTGSLASQDAIDHVKEVAGKVQGVISVDTSALILASL
jgi:hyperosmotically inducible periplasmic protein